MMRTSFLFAASSWPFAVVLAAPVFVIVFYFAFKLARNPSERIANMLTGLVGSFVAMIALGHMTDEDQWLREDDAFMLVVCATAAIGAVVGVAMSVYVRRILSRFK